MWDKLERVLKRGMAKGAMYVRTALEGDPKDPTALVLTLWEPEKKLRGTFAIPWQYVNKETAKEVAPTKKIEPYTLTYTLGRQNESPRAAKLYTDQDVVSQLCITQEHEHKTIEHSFSFCNGFNNFKITDKQLQFNNMKFPLPAESFVWYCGNESYYYSDNPKYYVNGCYDHETRCRVDRENPPKPAQTIRHLDNLVIVINGQLLVAPYALPFFNAAGNIKAGGKNIHKLFRDIISSKKMTSCLATGPHRKQVAGLISQIPTANRRKMTTFVKKMNGIDFRSILNVVENKRKISKKQARKSFRKLGAYKLRFLLL